jgi:type IV secretion system protein VirB9
MNTNFAFWPALLLLLAGSVAAVENDGAAAVQVPNIPPELIPPAETLVETDNITETSSPPCEEVDCFPAEVPMPSPSVSSPPSATEKVTSRPTPPAAVRIGPPAQRAVIQSHDWAENPSAMPKLDSGGRVVFQFSESAPTIVCAPLRVCDIELQPGETVQGAPHIGDGVRWKIGPAVSGSEDARVTHLIVKPTEANLDTNLIVPTDRRTYHLRLVSSDHHYVSSVAFDYPEDQRLAWNALSKANMSGSNQAPAPDQDLPRVAVNRLNFNYKIKVVKGKPSFKPLRAMDDGYHTYIAMNEDLPQKEAPALIGISPDGNEQMINYRLKGNLYVVDGSVYKLALISGVGGDQQRIELTRNACERRGWLGICWDSKE